MADMKELDAALSSGDEDALVKELRQIKNKKSSRQNRIQKTLEVLQNAKSSRVRNAAAIALADMKGVEAKDALVAMLRQRDTRDARGTLLYALDQISEKTPIDVLVDIIVNDRYEAREEAVNLIKTGKAQWTESDLLCAKQTLQNALSSPDEEVREAIGSALEYMGQQQATTGPASSRIYGMFEQAMRSRKQILCIYGGYPRELCSIILGHSQGQEKALAYQFGGRSKSGLPPGGQWRCLWLAKVSNVELRDGPWFVGSSHTQPQGCVEIVDLDVNPSSPYRPKRAINAIRRQPARRRAGG